MTKVRKTENIRSAVLSFDMAKQVVKELGDDASVDWEH
jgi:hypothetical protein